ncbi:methyltransferase domain-containing protein [Candidatus Woesearchaeota archaeon]|nr:methyltransferase domain-containing protein [Candidatus Woesearchaeota archaeon]
MVIQQTGIVEDGVFTQTLQAGVLDDVRVTLEDYLSFYEDFTRQSEPGWPSWAQSIRVRALLKKKRVLVADDPGVNGKTFSAIASKIALERETGSSFPTFVVSPNSGMINAWSEASITDYAAKLHARPQRVLTVRAYEDLAHATPNLDFLVINWEKLSVEPQSQEWQGIERALNVMNPQFFAIDELHNGKSATSLRGQTLQRLTAHTIGKYLMALSATPIPNRYRDLSIVFHLLDPLKFSSPSMFTYSPAEVMRELLARQVWFRLTRQDMKEDLGLGDFREEVVPFELSRQEAEAYFRAWSACVTVGEGLSELRKILYNSRLSKYAAAAPEFSSKMVAVAAKVDELVRQGHKVAIKADYVNGVLDPLAKLLSERHDTVVVKSEHSLEERKEFYDRFRDPRGPSVLLVGPHSNESVDLTTGSIPLDELSIEPEMTPGEKGQWTGRGYRRGQTADVTHYSFVAQSSVLNDWMRAYVAELCQNFGVRLPRNFVPRTIDSDMLAMCSAKERVIEKIYGGRDLTREEESLYDANPQDFNAAMRHLESMVAPGSFKSIKPFQVATLMQTRWRNLGEEGFEQLIQTKGWAGWTRRYEAGWRGSASEETLRILGGIIELDRKRSSDYTVVDVGAGAAYFSRATGIPSVCVDIDGKFLELGRKECDRLGIQNRYIASRATSIPELQDGTADAVVNSYAIFYIGQDGDRNEVEKSVIETNRILRDGGLFLISLPYTIDDVIVKRFTANMGQYGFAPSIYYSPLETKRENMTSGCHILGFRKTADIRAEQGLDMSFYGVNGQVVKFLG